MLINNSSNIAQRKISEELPSYKASEAATYTSRFIRLIKSVRNAAVLKGDHGMAAYINTAHCSHKMLNNIYKNKMDKALVDLQHVKKHSDELFAIANVSILYKHIYYAREIYRNIDVILNND
ncbi:hypothetical protein [Vagococcus sp. WN89Y]|uniref:hypothetical protein n=1 Tax=Vagococcus sp. WN89Y TaxID=3457258 RepID=UPI003FCE917E